LTKKIDSVFILGATSLIARSLCLELAKSGCKKFHLISKKIEDNKYFVEDLHRTFNIEVNQEEIDIYENFLKNKVLEKYEEFDLYIILVGYLGNEKKARFDIDESYKISIINYLGIIQWIDTISNNERINKAGRLWIFTSVAGDKGRPSNYHYGASKSALITHCEGLYYRCYKKPFKIRIIKPGFMATPMSEGKAPKMLCISPNEVAKTLLKNPNKEGIEYLPFWWSVIMLIIRFLPRKIINKL